MTSQTKHLIAIVVLLIVAIALGAAYYFRSAEGLQYTIPLFEEEVDLLEPDVEDDLSQEPVVEEERAPSIYPSYSFIATPDTTRPGVPFGNGTGVQIVDDAIVTVHSENRALYVTRHQLIDDEVVAQSTELSYEGSWSTPGALSESDESLVFLYLTDKGMYTRMSDDGGLSWNEPVRVGENPVGPATPSACLWHEDGELRSLIAWVAPPQSGDGGPVYVGEWDGEGWEVVEVGDFSYASSPSLDCDEGQQSIVLRVAAEAGSTSEIDLYFARRDAAGNWPEPEYVFAGADPHLAVCDEQYWIGYHHRGYSYASSQDAGESWEKTSISTTSKFGSISCDGDVVVTSWGLWPTLRQANERDPDTRQLSAQVSFDNGETWQSWAPVGEETGHGTASSDVVEGAIVLFWRSPEGVHVATY